MTDWSELKRRLKRKSRESRARTDILLDEELQALMAATTADLEALRPKVTDQETYDRLIGAVSEATRQNESIAVLHERLKALGSGVVSLAKTTAGLLKPL